VANVGDKKKPSFRTERGVSEIPLQGKKMNTWSSAGLDLSQRTPRLRKRPITKRGTDEPRREGNTQKK